MKITAHNAYFTSSEPYRIKELLEVPNPAKQYNAWADEKVRFYDQLGNRFPIGFLPYVYEKLENKPEIIWERSPNLKPVFPHPLLRPEQKRVSNAVINNKFQDHSFVVGVVDMVTGSGKSYDTSDLIGQYHPYRVLLLTANKAPHSVNIDRLKRDWGHNDPRRRGKPYFPKQDTFMRIGSYAGQTWQAGSYCTVAMMQTIVARLKPISHRSKSACYTTAKNYKAGLKKQLNDGKITQEKYDLLHDTKPPVEKDDRFYLYTKKHRRINQADKQGYRQGLPAIQKKYLPNYSNTK